ICTQARYGSSWLGGPNAHGRSRSASSAGHVARVGGRHTTASAASRYRLSASSRNGDPTTTPAEFTPTSLSAFRAASTLARSGSCPTYTAESPKRRAAPARRVPASHTGSRTTAGLSGSRLATTVARPRPPAAWRPVLGALTTRRPLASSQARTSARSKVGLVGEPPTG